MVNLSAYLEYKTKGVVTMDELRINELNDYQEKALRTWNKDVPWRDRVVNASLGQVGEAGEVADLVKKAIYHGHGFCLNDSQRGLPKIIEPHEVAKELGDQLFYISVMAEEFGYSLQEIAEININKLAKRYPEGFSVEASINRVDVTKEEN